MKNVMLSGNVVEPLLRVVIAGDGIRGESVDESLQPVTPRPVQPEPFVRGAAYPSVGDVPYPRANPSDTARLPADIWHAATVPVGVRLELVGTAEAVDVAYRTTSGNLGYRGDGAGITFSVWRGSRKVCEEEAVLGDGMVRLSLGAGTPDKPAIIYLPEGMQPVVQSLTAVKGGISPAPQLPRWIAYGDAITQGWIASGPAQGWAAIAARKAGLDVVNLGFAAAGRGEIVSAEHIAALPADVISIAYGASCWTRIPHSVGMVAEGFTGFLDVVREGHPFTPIVVVSPFVRPDAEGESNRLGATLADIRDAIESVTRDRIASGDLTLTLVAGKSVIGAEHLGDAIHPDDEGHKRIASAMSKALKAAMTSAEQLPAPSEVDDKDTWSLGERDEFDGTDDGTDDSDGDDGGGVGGDDDVDSVESGGTEDDDATGDAADEFDDSSVAAGSSAG
jgi:lysophospholipase L1-like esterase